MLESETLELSDFLPRGIFTIESINAAIATSTISLSGGFVVILCNHSPGATSIFPKKLFRDNFADNLSISYDIPAITGKIAKCIGKRKIGLGANPHIAYNAASIAAKINIAPTATMSIKLVPHRG